jgi:Rha family phage regulatory protein
MNALAVIAPTLNVVNGQATTTSTDVAKFFHKRHDIVLRAIENVREDLDESNRRNFAVVEYTDQKGERRPAYLLTRKGFTLLAMGFTGKRALGWKLTYIDAFDAMEEALRQPQHPALPSHTITPAQAGELFTLMAERFPEGKDRPYAWGRFNNHYRIASYRELPVAHFYEAAKYIQRIPLRLPAPATHIQPPVWDSPKPSGMPDAPGRPRSIKTAERLVKCLQLWAREQLPPHAGEGVHQLCEELNGVLITGWTEVDEALIRFSIGRHMLERWMGRA